MKPILKFFYFTTYLLIILTACSQKAADLAENKSDEFNAGLYSTQKEEVKEILSHFPDQTELAVCLLKNGETVYFGFKNESGTATAIENEDKIFQIGSISKVFTATLLAKMVEENKLQLNQKAVDLIPEIENDNIQATLLQLANHTSGLPRLPNNLVLFMVDPKDPYKKYGEDDLLAYLKEAKPKNTAGKEYAYSNLGVGLLGYLLSQNAGKDYEQLISESIFAPYNMTRSGFSMTELGEPMAIGLDQFGKETPYWDMNILVGAGGILSSVKDLSKFAEAQFEAKDKAIQLTQTPTTRVSERTEVGLSWHILTTKSDNKLLTHSGGTGGFKSDITLDPVNKTGVIVLSNVSAFHKKSNEINQLSLQLMKSLSQR